MRSLYISLQGCQLTLRQETVLVQKEAALLDSVQLPLLEQILVFGRSQVTTSVLQSCLQRHIPVAFLSQMGRCYGRLMPLENESYALVEAQYAMSEAQALSVAQQLVQAKLKNSRVLLLRQQRRLGNEELAGAIAALEQLAQDVVQAESVPQVLGFEGAGAAAYFPALGRCLTNPEFTLTERTRRPPRDPVNAVLSFGYQVLWNHLLFAIENKGLDAYRACLHQPSPRHPALASDLLEQFRAPIVDSVMLYLVNSGILQTEEDFEFKDGACYLSHSGRKRYLQAFLHRMNESVQTETGEDLRWALLTQQVRAFMQVLRRPDEPYRAYLIR